MHFLDNKYTKWYYNIVNSARNKTDRISTFLETHHIIPVSFGGVSGESNVVRLTAREHYVCHLLLIKMTTGIKQQECIDYLDKFKSETSKQYQALRILEMFKNNLSVSQEVDISGYSKLQWAKLNRVLVKRTREFSTH